MSKIFLSTWTSLSLTLIALPGWATTSKILIKSDRNLAQLLSYSNSPHSISSNKVTHQKIPPTAKTVLENNQRLLGEKAVKNTNPQQKNTSRSSPQRGAPRPKPDRD
ncbi:MAG TPA: hypothetical protein V6D15_01220 [Oculatellaceae cyanobacterium]|jgi:hypothetical protein